MNSIILIQDQDLLMLTIAFIQCDSFTVLFENESSSSAITNYVWNFGDSIKNSFPQSGSVQHTYKDTGVNKAFLTVTGPKGCIGIDRLTRILSVSEKPLLQVPFKDTLVCSIDSLPINISNTNSSNVIVYPSDTTQHIVSINNNGCISKDSIDIKRVPYPIVNVGNDTLICFGNSCFGEDFIKILEYKGGPDILRPVPIGIAQLNYFKLYNRWGQLIFSTTEMYKSWNGIFNREQQPTGTYIFQAEGKDFTGKIICTKVTAVLIR